MTATVDNTVGDKSLERLRERAAAEGLLDVAYARADSPFGTLLLARTPRGLVRLALPSEDVDATLSDAADVVREAGLEVETFAREGDPADAILDVAEERDADLIVVGNKGMTGARRFLLGSVPNKVSHHAPCSVLIVRTT